MTVFDRHIRFTAEALKDGWDELGAHQGRHESWAISWDAETGRYVLRFFREGALVLIRNYSNLGQARWALGRYVTTGEVPK